LVEKKSFIEVNPIKYIINYFFSRESIPALIQTSVRLTFEHFDMNKQTFPIKSYLFQNFIFPEIFFQKACLCVSICVSVCVSICLYVCVSVCVSVCVRVWDFKKEIGVAISISAGPTIFIKKCEIHSRPFFHLLPFISLETTQDLVNLLWKVLILKNGKSNEFHLDRKIKWRKMFFTIWLCSR
jgi:hypothetical protein